jgi:hypothetical protein
MFAVPAVICYTFLAHPLRFGLGIAALFLASSLYHGVFGTTEARLRSFFGVHRVSIDPTSSFRLLIHGNTIHGQQSLAPKKRRIPLTYYHPSGPAGHAFAALEDDERLRRVGLVGLGTGALSCYAKAGQRWTFFEIDPAVISLARDSGLFSYLRDCEADLDYEEGDARLALARGEERFGLLVIDAFSSDAIPVHLLTREAIQIYRKRLTPDGLMLFNISNRYLDLRPVLAALAEDAGLVCLYQEDLGLTSLEKREGKAPSQWIVLAPRREAVRKLLRRGVWQTLQPGPDDPVWTDEYKNPLRVLR